MAYLGALESVVAGHVGVGEDAVLVLEAAVPTNRVGSTILDGGEVSSSCYCSHGSREG